MSSSILKPLFSDGEFSQVIIGGSFHPAGTGTTAPTGVVGDGFTVVQSATGVYDVTFANIYPQRIAFTPSIKVASETQDATVQWGDEVAATASVGQTIRIRAMVGGTPTDFSSDSTSLISFIALYARSVY